jgi:hypothetical protein
MAGSFGRLPPELRAPKPREMPREQSAKPEEHQAEAAHMGDGKNSGVTADDVSGAPNIGAIKPASSKPIQQTEVGDRYIDRGAICDGKGHETPGCLFSDAQRARLIGEIKHRAVSAAANYKIALTQLRFEELLKKEADLHWAASIALDLVGAHLIKVVANGVMALKSTGIAKLDAEIDGRYLSDNTLRSRADEMLRSMDEKSIESKVKTVFDPLKKGFAGVAKGAVNKDNKTEKSSNISFIDQLTDQCDVGFNKFSSLAAGNANDAELHVIFEGLAPENHTVGAYKEALGAKLDRFKKSGVNDLGRQRSLDREFRHANVIRDTRVVWIEQADGSKVLHYQSVEASYNPNVIRRGDPDTGDLFRDEDEHFTFGDRKGRSDVRVDGRVPLEFVDVALARSEQVWGTTPTIARPANPFVPKARPSINDAGQPRPVQPDWKTLPDAFKSTKVRQ